MLKRCLRQDAGWKQPLAARRPQRCTHAAPLSPPPPAHLGAEEARALARLGSAVARKVALAAALEAAQARLLKVLVKVPASLAMRGRGNSGSRSAGVTMASCTPNGGGAAAAPPFSLHTRSQPPRR